MHVAAVRLISMLLLLLLFQVFALPLPLLLPSLQCVLSFSFFKKRGFFLLPSLVHQDTRTKVAKNDRVGNKNKAGPERDKGRVRFWKGKQFHIHDLPGFDSHELELFRTSFWAWLRINYSTIKTAAKSLFEELFPQLNMPLHLMAFVKQSPCTYVSDVTKMMDRPQAPSHECTRMTRTHCINTHRERGGSTTVYVAAMAIDDENETTLHVYLYISSSKRQ